MGDRRKCVPLPRLAGICRASRNLTGERWQTNVRHIKSFLRSIELAEEEAGPRTLQSLPMQMHPIALRAQLEPTALRGTRGARRSSRIADPRRSCETARGR